MMLVRSKFAFEPDEAYDKITVEDYEYNEKLRSFNARSSFYVSRDSVFIILDCITCNLGYEHKTSMFKLLLPTGKIVFDIAKYYKKI